MKKKVLKIIALIIAIALIVGICWVANGLNGNPISKMLAKKAANEYLEENFSDTDYYIEELGFSFKFSNYYAHVRSVTSIDTQFTLHIDMLGNVYFDTYESVTGGFVTARRVEQEYRELTNQIFENPSFPYPSDIGYGTLEIYPQEALDDPDVNDIPDYALVQQDLILDQIYDIRELGRQAGHLIIYVESETISFELAAQIMLDIRAEFEKANIPFRAMDFVMQLPLPEEGPRPDEEVRVKDFRYEDIYQENLIDRIKAAHEELETYYAEQDAKYK